ncbi:hypothetical protein Y032_0632g876 [Ancylostoma ceylanicum]|uniref:Reverse transcriptase domain-containing protein n=1 Tax=Ancylostoma ceylanicum TaxID=53326 RepID=A0A016WL77_9BILA|nr:hypothetical protein Y032_0632g876 [Ancylostoma ceylanicum]
MKIFERVLDRRLRDIVGVTRNQCGFGKNCRRINAIHAVRLLTEKHREKKKTVHLSFLDLEKAFNRIPRDLIWPSLRAHRVPEEYVKWVQLLYMNVTSSVRSTAGTSARSPVKTAVDASLCRRCRRRCKHQGGAPERGLERPARTIWDGI